MEFLVPALDGQGFQTLLVAGQVALENTGKCVEVGDSTVGQVGGQPPRDTRHRSENEELVEHDGRQEKCLSWRHCRTAAKRVDPSPKEECLPKHRLELG